MKKNLLATLVIATTATGFAVNAASDVSNPAAAAPVNWMPVADVVAKLESRGYKVLEIEREDGRYYEVEMRDANGFEVEAYLDARTGEPRPKKYGSDDGYDDKDGRSDD